MQNKKLHPRIGVFGHGAWGMGHREEITNDGSCFKPTAVRTTGGTPASGCLGNPSNALPPQCAMPQAAISAPKAPKGKGVSRRFQSIAAARF